MKNSPDPQLTARTKKLLPDINQRGLTRRGTEVASELLFQDNPFTVLLGNHH